MLALALAFAVAAHGSQTRKGTQVPYVSHLLQVSGLVFEHGGDLEQATAALLHDVVEDTAVTLEQVAASFGPGVAVIVGDCSDTGPDEAPDSKRPWIERKREHLAHMREVSARSALIVGCDKLHNLRSTVADLEVLGPSVLGRFNAPPAQQRWLYGELLAALRDKLPPRLHAELTRLCERYAALTEGL